MLAVARRPPRKEYLLLLAHPPMTTPYTASESTARMKSDADVEAGDLERPAVGDVGRRRRGATGPSAIDASRRVWRSPSTPEQFVRRGGRRRLDDLVAVTVAGGDRRSASTASTPPQGMTAMLRMTTMIIMTGAMREEDPVDALGPVVFLQDELQPVGQRLAEAEHLLVLQERDDAEAEADAVGADAVLHPRGDLPLEQDQVRHRPRAR